MFVAQLKTGDQNIDCQSEWIQTSRCIGSGIGLSSDAWVGVGHRGRKVKVTSGKGDSI